MSIPRVPEVQLASPAVMEKLAALDERYPEIIALHKAYAEQELGGIDDALHLLVYDILHTAYAEQFYPKGYTRGSTSRERAKAVKEKADRAELCIRIGPSVSRSCRSCWRTLLRCPT